MSAGSLPTKNIPAPSSGTTPGYGEKAQTVKVPRCGPSTFRPILPFVLCLISFATVFSILIIYMDTTEFRHQQFRLNMSRDYELLGVEQDNPNLITYLREIHMQKYPIPFLHNLQVEHTNHTDYNLIQKVGSFIAENYLQNKMEGIFLQSFPGGNEYMMSAQWFVEQLNWTGYIIEPDPKRYFAQRKFYMEKPKVQAIHACISPNEYPKEVTIHYDKENEVKINSVFDEESDSEWFYSRVKCFPVFTIMLAVNQTSLDLLSLGCNQQDLQILQTIPFDRVNIRVITIYIKDATNEGIKFQNQYTQNVTNFLKTKSYKLVKIIENNFIYLKNIRNLKNL